MKYNLYFLLCLIVLLQIFSSPNESFGQTIYYVSTSFGNDSFNGQSENTPWKTIEKINSQTFKPGDQILFRRGDKFNDASLVIYSSGNNGNPIIFGAYGNGNTPIIGSYSSPWVGNTRQGILISHQSYITIQNLHIIAPYNTSSRIGYAISCESVKHVNINNCEIDGKEGGNFQLRDGIASVSSTDLNVYKNDLHDLCNMIDFYDTKSQITYNTIHSTYPEVHSADAIDCKSNGYILGGSYAFNHNYESIIAHNEIYDWGEDAIDLYLSSNVIVEYNDIHNPNKTACGVGINLGPLNRGNIIRYNKFHNFHSENTSHDASWEQPYYYNIGINIKGEKTGDIYYNLFYDVAVGINFVTYYDPNYYPGETEYDGSKQISVYNNTVIARYFGIQAYGFPSFPYVRNNIFSGGNYDVALAHFDMYGAGNIFVNGTKLLNGRTYQHIDGGASDKNNIDLSSIFLDYSNNDFTLKSGSPAIGAGDAGLKDILGNIISDKPDIGAIPYNASTNQASGLKIYLEGCYENGTMTTNLDNQKIIPLSQTYVGEPWNYPGDEEVNSIPKNIVDWVLVELRKTTDFSSEIVRQAAFINLDGKIVDLSGSHDITFSDVTDGDYYVVVIHRNHLAVMSSHPINLTNGNFVYDFTTGEDKAYGTNALADLGNGVYGMYGGDSDSNGIIDDSDVNDVGNSLFSINYLLPDIDLNSKVNVLDYKLPKKNLGKKTFVTGIFAL